MLAMVVNDNACLLDKRGAWEPIASRLAPTGFSEQSAQVQCHVPPHPRTPCRSRPARRSAK
ncbi:hypothetical protein EKG40_16315 [Pseudomonas moorei]|nr:hypothetical protein EKG40_16315 [Pseudomonas moorei]